MENEAHLFKTYQNGSGQILYGKVLLVQREYYSMSNSRTRTSNRGRFIYNSSDYILNFFFSGRVKKIEHFQKFMIFKSIPKMSKINTTPKFVQKFMIFKINIK